MEKVWITKWVTTNRGLVKADLVERLSCGGAKVTLERESYYVQKGEWFPLEQRSEAEDDIFRRCSDEAYELEHRISKVWDNYTCAKAWIAATIEMVWAEHCAGEK